MRSFFCAFIPLLVMLVIGCSTVDPDECWPNTSGGFGGGETIPIGAGVGATSSGDFITPPPYDPLNHGGPSDNPCVEHDDPSPTSPSPSESTCQVPTQEGNGATAWVCTDACLSKCPAPGGALYVKFYPSDFPFVTTIKDDGTGNGGGWQEAKANLEFTRAVIPWSVVTWWCSFTIGMPLRTEFMGKISASQAASYSIEITEGVARGMDFSLPQGIFCEKFIVQTRAAFKSKYKQLGATVTK